MTARGDMIFVGLKGTVLGLDRATGATKWSTHLQGSDFVNVTTIDGDLFATCKGRLYRIDPASGDVRWCNELPGMGFGLATIASASQVVPAAEKKRRDAAAAAAAAASA